MKTILLSVICLLAGSRATQAQFSKIDTDRPDQTESAGLVPKRWIQFEMGFNRQQNSRTEKEYYLPTLLSKYGMGKRIELRLITTIKRFAEGNGYATGIEPVEIGTKIALREEKKWLPKTSLLVHLAIPGLASKKLKAGNWAPNFRFSLQHTLSGWLGIGYNLGAEWDGFSNDPAWIYTLSPGFNISEKWYAYIELFGSIANGAAAQHNVDGGLAYYFNSNIKADISSGMGLSPASPDWYVAIGFSVRFKTGR